MRVLKFGGSSLADAERFLRVADIAVNTHGQSQVALVLSAPAKVTNHLVALVEQTSRGMDASSTLFEINGIFSRLLAGLKAAYPALDDKALQTRLTAELDQVERLMQGIRLLGLCPDNVQARILSRGENLSIAFMHELLRVRGLELDLIVPEQLLVTDGGYLHGALAPGHRSKYEAPIASHNLMRAHGAAVKAYREIGKHEIGLVVNIEPKYPASESAEDAAAVRRAHAYMNEQYLHPALLGHYPPELKEIFGDAWPEWPAEDYDLIKQKVDFIGINYYTRSVTKAAESYPLNTGVVRQPLGTSTETGWEVFPPGLTDLLLWFKQTYGDIPVYITENGAAYEDVVVGVDAERRVHDEARTSYYSGHVGAVADAIDAGADVRGYFAWSLLDNFEWAEGYTQRFGLVHVGADQERVTKNSYAWLRDRIRTLRSSG